MRIIRMLLEAGADALYHRGAVHSRKLASARELAAQYRDRAVVRMIDAFTLRRHLFNLCCALKAADWPVLVVLECFAWSSAFVGERLAPDAQLPLDVQWQIAKKVKSELSP